jgi:hypothetical protein
MGPYAGNKVFEMACLFWFNKKDQINDKRINSRKIKVVTRAGMVSKERKGIPSQADYKPYYPFFLPPLIYHL